MDLMEARRAILIRNDILPPTYKSVDYIVSTGQGAYINTGVSGNDDTLSFECTFLITELYNYAGIFGNYTGSGQKAWRLIQGTSPTWLAVNCHTSNASILYIPGNNYVGEKLTVRVNTSETTCIKGSDSRTSASGAKAGTETGYNIALGKHAAANPSATVTGTYQTRFYGFKIWRDNLLIRDYIPCLRLIDNIAGMWDKVNKTFNPSTSIYDFGYGND